MTDSGQCRGCLKQSSLLDMYELSLGIRDRFEKCTSLPVSKDDHLPQQICARCWKRCQNWQEFRDLCQESDKRLRRGVNPVKSEIPETFNKDDFNDYFDNNQSNSDDEENKDDNEEEYNEPTKPIEEILLIEPKTQKQSDQPLSCPICFAQHASTQGYEKHVREHYSKRIKNHCMVCNKRFTTKNSVIKHTFEHGPTNIPCPICNRKFNGSLQLKSHINKYHKDQRKGEDKEEAPVDTPDESMENDEEDYFESEDDHDEQKVDLAGVEVTVKLPGEHILSPGDQLKCPMCEKEFQKEDVYDNHIKAHYSEKEEPKCQICSKEFPTIEETINHTHGHGFRCLSCSFCGKTFKGRYQLRAHINQMHMRLVEGTSAGSKVAQKSVKRPVKVVAEEDEDVLECPVCNKVFEEEQVYDAHIKDHYTKECRQCLLCFSSYTTTYGVVQHTHEHSKREIRCICCERTFRGRHQLKQHVNKYHRDEKESGVVPAESIKVNSRLGRKKAATTDGFVCEFCSDALPSLDKLNEHMIIKHWDQQESDFVEIEEQEEEDGSADDREKDRHPEDKLICPVCHAKNIEMELPTVKEYEEHMKMHYRGQTDNKCLICDKQYTTAYSVIAHTAEHGFRVVPCTYCPRLFKGQHQMRVHLTKYHVRQRREVEGKAGTDHVCNVCGKTYALAQRLKIHMLVHTNERPFDCQYCNRQFKLQRALTLHELTHTGERTVSCPKCDQKFFHRKHMTDHLKRHTDTATKMFVCEYESCDKVFRYKHGLAEHLNSHTRSRMFCCEICGKEFTRVSILNRHRQMHLEKSNVCGVCGKGFTRQDHLETHMRVHMKNGDVPVEEEVFEEQEEEHVLMDGIVLEGEGAVIMEEPVAEHYTIEIEAGQ